MNFETILLEGQGAIRTLTIQRPEKLNALNRQVIDELSKAVDYILEDSAIRTVILTGSGEKAFVAGADISEFAGFSKEEGEELSAEGQAKLFDKIQNAGTPFIAAVNGFALGGGLELAMSCHIRVVSTTARMGLPEVSLGVIPGYGGTQRLAQLIGKGRALELIMTAKMITADQAMNWGLANHKTEPAELMEKCIEIASAIVKNSPTAISAAIRAVNAQFEENVNGFDVEIEAFGSCFGTADFAEGTAAFLEKRKPNFSGH